MILAGEFIAAVVLALVGGTVAVSRSLKRK
jgi:hypothetical protein